MRIRKSASRLLGSTYSASAAPAPDVPPPFGLLAPTPPPPQPRHLVPCSAPESRGGGGFAGPATASGEPCDLSRSPWDLIAELALSDPQVDDDLVDKYFVHVACQASWLFSASMPAASAKKKEKLAVPGGDCAQLRRHVAKKAAMSKEKEKEGEAKKKAKVKEEEGEEGATQVWKCKKNNGKKWHCHRTMATVAAPAAASKSSTSSKPPKKKPGNDFNATEGFYYYTGFGSFRSKRHCRSSMHDSVPVKQEEEEELPEDDASPPSQPKDQANDDDTNRAAARDDMSRCQDDIFGIAGGDDDDFDGLGTCGHSMNGNGDPRASNGGSKSKTPWKRWRKPVKARSLRSLM